MTLAAAVVLAAATLFGACGRADSDIRAHVSAQLSVDPETRSSEIAVRVERGVVYLEGETPTRGAQRRAVAIARDIDGVDQVVDGLRLSDAAVARAVREALSADPVVGGLAIGVTSDRGVVRLTSEETSSDQRQRAVAVASGLDGVEKVEDWMK